MLSLWVVRGRCEVYQKVFPGSSSRRIGVVLIFFPPYSSAALNKSGSYEDYELESELRSEFILIILSNMSNTIFEVFVTELCLVGNVKRKFTFTQHRSGEVRGAHQARALWKEMVALRGDSDFHSCGDQKSHKLRLTISIQYITKWWTLCYSKVKN